MIIAPPGFEPGSTDPESVMNGLKLSLIWPLHYGAGIKRCKEKAVFKII